MKIEKTTINHSLVFTLFIGGLFCAIVGTAVLFRLILPAAHAESIFLAQAFVGVGWIFSWVLRGWYKNSRDLSINDMGPITLSTYIGAVEQVNDNKFRKTE